jgi:hypothetical protein
MSAACARGVHFRTWEREFRPMSLGRGYSKRWKIRRNRKEGIIEVIGGV